MFETFERAVEYLRLRKGEAFLIHHDEADGVCSAALAKVALEEMGYVVKTLCLDKLFPEILEKVFSESRVVVFTDIGSAHVDKIESMARNDSLVIIIDHHDTKPSMRSNVFNLNPELYGYSGESDASASTVSYFFAKSVDKSFSRLSYLPLIGSVEIPGEVTGLNRIALEDALRERVAERSGMDIKIVGGSFNVSRSRASQTLTILASVGYYRRGVEKAVEACLKGFSPETLKLAEALEEERKRANKALLTLLVKKGVNVMRNIQWFDSGEFFKGMGSKVVGSFTSYLSYQRFIERDKYLIGLMKIPREIPGYGLLKSKYVKVSSRAPPALRAMIEKGVKQPLSKILTDACARHGGFGDGHSVAASGVVPVGLEKDFLETLDKYAE
ncbi:MAG: DHH family phosphoesterase [Thermoproteota archaeon]